MNSEIRNLLTGTQATMSRTLPSDSEWWDGIEPITVYGNPVPVLWGETIYVTLEVMVDRDCKLRCDVNNYGDELYADNDLDSYREDDIDLSVAKAGEWVEHRYAWTNANESKNPKHVSLIDFSRVALEPGSHDGGDTTVSIRHLMVTKDGYAAWAPGEGESLAGGGAQMSANLLSGVSPKLLNGATYDGTAWLTPARPDTANTPTYYLEWPLSQARLTTNQTYRVAMGTMGDGGSGNLTAYLAYKDAAGNSNAVAVAIAYGTSWARSEATMVVPSGMTPYLLSICKWGKHPAVSVAGVVLSYGSPVTLASSAHTPYATQDHVAAEYSTKASQKILSDSITSEVKARAKTDGAVSELSTKMEQTVNGINVSLDRLAATDQQIRSWFDFGSDASGNPKLAMGSSSSPIIGEYSNTGTAYKSRSGATLLALDAVNSTTSADHMVAKDVTVGKWKWMPTNGGSHFTLMWIGG